MPEAVTNRQTLRATFLVLALAFAPLTLACAEVERVVVERETVPLERGDARTVAWESDRYGAHSAQHVASECWDAAAVGRPLPEACLTAAALATETDPFASRFWLAGALSLVAVAALLLFAWKMVGWRPEVERSTAGQPRPRHFDAGGAVALMQSTEGERSERIEADRQKRDPSYPFLTGAAIPLVALAALTLVVGYGRAVGWGFGTGVVLFFLAGPPVALIQLNLIRPANLDAALSRSWFLSGATATLMFGGWIALHVRAPLLRLNGIDWPF